MNGGIQYLPGLSVRIFCSERIPKLKAGWNAKLTFST